MTPRPASSRRLAALFAMPLLVLLSGAATAQVAGRVVLAVGDVVAVRGAERIRLASGAEISVGDSIVTGAQSHAQLRFSDAALVALKPDSEFRIETFEFTATAAGNERAVFRLVRGGFRTVTGSIGQINRDRYQLLTTQATIGIRGTHYALQSCAPGQCVTQGTSARPGLYGGVFDGILAIATALGDADYPAGEYFFVPDGEAPQRYLTPPDFLADRLPVRAVAAAPASGELKFASVPEFGLPPALPVPPFTYMATEDRNLIAPENARAIIVGSDRYTLELDTTRDPRLAIGVNGSGQVTSFANDSLAANVGSANIVDSGSDGTGAGLNWGRWEGKGSTIVQRLPDGTTVRNDGGNLHYIYGNLSPSLPGSGQFSYTPVGGTRPTDSGTGATGTLVSGGSINVNFGTAQLTLTGLTVGFTNATYTMGGTTGINNGLFSTSGPGASVGCTGNACQSVVAGNFAGFFAGAGGSGIGLDYFINARGGGVIEGVVGYRRCAGAGPC
jgi:hypothetical protein